MVPSHLLPGNEPGQAWSPEAPTRRKTLESIAGPDGSISVSVLDAVQARSLQFKARQADSNKSRSVKNRTQPRRASHAVQRGKTTGQTDSSFKHTADTSAGTNQNPLRRNTVPAILEELSPERLQKIHPQSRGSSLPAADDPPGLLTQMGTAATEQSPTTDDQLFKHLARFDFFQQDRYALNDPVPRQSDPFTDDQPSDPFADPPSSPLQSFPDVRSDGDLLGMKKSRTSSSTLQRSTSIVQIAAQEAAEAISRTKIAIAEKLRKSSVEALYEKAKTKSQKLQRRPWVQKTFEYSCYLLILLFLYFVLVGLPLWKGAVLWLYWVVEHKFTIAGTWSITIGLAVLYVSISTFWLDQLIRIRWRLQSGCSYAYLPLLLLFEKEPPFPDDEADVGSPGSSGAANTALVIPCYKAASIIGPTLVAAKRIFPPSHIFVVANGNSPTPLDNTEDVCIAHGVNHVWSPIGSKIVAQFVGGHAVAKTFENVLLIDDDCALPPNFPIVSDRMHGRVKCIGYTIKSTGPNSSIGSWCQQAQDLEYKLSGMQRAVAGFIGSATFPHGAISLWNTRFLIETLNAHPGFNVSEDWFFGHQARELGCRITMCTAVFVETETPSRIFFPEKGGARGGFGEMTVFKQRFYRWNFFFVNGLWYNLKYVCLSWKLGFWELGAKLFVLQEVCETLLYLLAPLVLPISLIVQPAFCGYLLAGTFGIYWINTLVSGQTELAEISYR